MGGLLELIIALGILSIIVVPMIITLNAGVMAASDTQNYLRAIASVRSAFYALQKSITANFDLTIAKYSTIDSEDVAIYINEHDNFTKEIIGSLKWNFLGRTRRTEYGGVVIDEEALAEGNICAIPLGDASEIIEESALFLGGTTVATDVDVRGRYAYISANSSYPPDPDLYVVDITGDTLFVTSSLHTGPGISALALYGDYAYLAQESVSGQLQVVSIANHASPILISTVKIPGVAAFGGSGVGKSIFYKNKKIFIGLTKSSGPEFHIFDVALPHRPQWLGSYETNTAVNGIYVKGERAYIVTPQEEVILLDVSDPSHIRKTGVFDAPLGSGNGKSVEIIGEYVVVGRTKGGNELYVLDKELAYIAQFNINTSVNTVRAVGQHFILGTIDAEKEIQVVRYHDGNFSVQAVYDAPDRVMAADCQAGKIYATMLGEKSFVRLSLQQHE